MLTMTLLEQPFVMAKNAGHGCKIITMIFLLWTYREGKGAQKEVWMGADGGTHLGGAYLVVQQHCFLGAASQMIKPFRTSRTLPQFIPHVCFLSLTVSAHMFHRKCASVLCSPKTVGYPYFAPCLPFCVLTLL